MKGDFTKFLFRPTDHFVRVNHQQGRVQLDSELNLQADLDAHRHETTAGDIIGPDAAPVGAQGFRIAMGSGNFRISKGRFYANGILIENEGPTNTDQAVTFLNQPDLPGATFPTVTAGEFYLIYLDVWLRHLSAVERPEFLEVALNGPDTATRTKVVWQVKMVAIPSEFADLACVFPVGSPLSTGMLAARGQPIQTPTSDCVVPAGAGFRRLENQNYRIEIHTSTATDVTPTYKWSRDNGSIVTQLLGIDGNVLTLADLGKDAATGFAAGQWVEISDEGKTLRGEPGVLVQLASINPPTVAAWPAGPAPTFADFTPGPVTVRRWDSPGAVPITAGDFVDLEDGVQVRFTPGDYRTGDYWSIPARTATGSVEWPTDASGPINQRALGIVHHLFSLAVFQAEDAGTTWTQISDCSQVFLPLTKLNRLVYLSGDGQEATPDPTQPTLLIELGEPLRVGLTLRSGVEVLFTVTKGAGRLQGTDQTTVRVFTDSNGVASCTWEVDSTTVNQEVTAQALDSPQPGFPVTFHATLNIAADVAYDPGSCAGLNGAITVQSALDRITAHPELLYVGGDGQSVLPGVPTPRPLQVSVMNDCGPVVGSSVRFVAEKGGLIAADAAGLAGATDTIVLTADDSGVVTCFYQPANDTTLPSQQVEARLLDASASPIGQPVHFNVSLSLASLVAYDPSACANLAGATTVQQALDILCREGDGGKPIHIREVRLGDGTQIKNDMALSVTSMLVQGLRISFDRALDPAAFARPNSPRFSRDPVCYVTVDLPYPLTTVDFRAIEADNLSVQLGFWPLVLPGLIKVSENTIVWGLAGSADYINLFQSIFTNRDRFPVVTDRLLARLTLKGNFIWARDGLPTATTRGDYLDGRPYGFPEADGTVGLVSPIGDGRNGTDFEKWFWLLSPQIA